MQLALPVGKYILVGGEGHPIVELIYPLPPNMSSYHRRRQKPHEAWASGPLIFHRAAQYHYYHRDHASYSSHFSATGQDTLCLSSICLTPNQYACRPRVH